MTLIGTFIGEDFPLESILRRKLRNVGQDGGRFRVTYLDMSQEDTTEPCKTKEGEDD